jgi:hypothetical protein
MASKLAALDRRRNERVVGYFIEHLRIEHFLFFIWRGDVQIGMDYLLISSRSLVAAR